MTEIINTAPIKPNISFDLLEKIEIRVKHRIGLHNYYNYLCTHYTVPLRRGTPSR